jgi:hypothetical protein
VHPQREHQPSLAEARKNNIKIKLRFRKPVAKSVPVFCF